MNSIIHSRIVRYFSRMLASTWVGTILTIFIAFSLAFCAAGLQGSENKIESAASTMFVSALVLGIANGLIVGVIPFSWQTAVVRKVLVSIVVALIVSSAASIYLIVRGSGLTSPFVIVGVLLAYALVTSVANFGTLWVLRNIEPRTD